MVKTILLLLLQTLLPAFLGAAVWRLTLPLRGGSIRHPRERALLLLFMADTAILFLTLTPQGFWNRLLVYGRLPERPRFSLNRVNLIPFRVTLRQYSYYLRREMWGVLAVNFLGNLLIFLPVGFLSALLSDKPRWWKSMAAAGVFSLMVETLQLFIDRGTDVDDLILNTVGGLLGYWAFLLFRRCWPELVRRCGKKGLGDENGCETGN